MRNIVLAAALALVFVAPAQATTGPGCLRVVNVASWDTLNIRARASGSSRIVGEIDPGNYGVISLRGPCRPKSASWGKRWCPITHFYGGSKVSGFVRARFVRDSDCP